MEAGAATGTGGRPTAAGLLPPEVVVVEAYDDAVPAHLFPEEVALLGRAVDKRRLEFGTARRCAREALARLGHPPAPLLKGRRGEPLWPAGVVGAITHCAGYRVAAVARAGDVAALGLDAEPAGPLPGGVLESIALPAELAQVRRLLASRPGGCWDRLLFSAKEAVYKAWYPLARRELDFAEAAIVVDPDRGTFSARFLVPGPVCRGVELPGFAGRWSVGGGLVLTAVALPAR